MNVDLLAEPVSGLLFRIVRSGPTVTVPDDTPRVPSSLSLELAVMLAGRAPSGTCMSVLLLGFSPAIMALTSPSGSPVESNSGGAAIWGPTLSRGFDLKVGKGATGRSLQLTVGGSGSIGFEGGSR